MMDSSSLVSYDSSPTIAAPTHRSAIPQFMVENAYTVAPITSPRLSQYGSDSSFVYTPYTPQTSPTLTGSFKQYSEEYAPPRPGTNGIGPLPASYQGEDYQTRAFKQDTIPEIKYEPQVASQRLPSPIPPAASKTIRRSTADSQANEIEFSTNVDVLMKAIQLRGGRRDNSDRGKDAYPSPPRVDEDKFSLRRKLAGSERPTARTLLTRKSRHTRYVCDVDGCKKRCTQKTQLETHKRSHTGERPYPCPEPGCERKFTQRGNLKTHMRSHTGERPYSCDLCGQTFAQRGNVKPHRLTHSKNKPFTCTLDGCRKTFGTRGNLKTHHNHFHAETLRDLTFRFSNLSHGARLSEQDQQLFNHFAELYKNSNKGIKGRGKDRDRGDSLQLKRSPTPIMLHRYPPQPSVAALNIHQQSRLHGQHVLPYAEGFENYGMPRTGPGSAAYAMYDMDQSSVASSDMESGSSSPVTNYEEDTMLPQHRIY